MAKSNMANAVLEECKSPEDKELLDCIANKDRQAFEQLYRRYAHRVAHFVGKMIRDRQTVEEVVDDTLFAIWKSAGAYQQRSRVSTWIFGIAYRQALKALEKERKHLQVDSDMQLLEAIEDPKHESNPATQTEVASMKKLVARGMERLSVEHRTAVQLTAMGHSYQEIAAIVGCPPNTVKTRVFYARRNLKEFLGQHNTTFFSNERPNPS